MNIEEIYKLFQKHPVVTTDTRDCPPGSIFIALKGSTMHINLTPSTFHPRAPLDSRAGERTEKYESGGFITSMPFLGQERTRLFKEDK